MKSLLYLQKNEKMIVVTGACYWQLYGSKLNSMGLSDIILVDDFTPEKKKETGLISNTQIKLIETIFSNGLLKSNKRLKRSSIWVREQTPPKGI